MVFEQMSRGADELSRNLLFGGTSVMFPCCYFAAAAQVTGANQ